MSKENDATDMKRSGTPKKTTLVLIALLFLWAVLLAIGANVNGGVRDFRKPLIVLGTIGAFATLWLIALSRKKD